MNLAAAFLAAGAGGFIGHKAGLPQGMLLGALFGVITLNLVSETSSPKLPAPALFAMYVLVAVELGAGVNRAALSSLAKAWLPAVLFVVVLLAATVAASFLMNRYFGLDLATAFFGTAPGALSGITAMARREGANAAVVIAMHTLRVVGIVIATPIIYRLLVKK